MSTNLDEYTRIMNAHNARWEPAIAAIQIAKAMRTIVRLAPLLSQEERRHIDATGLSLTADILERTVHFTPLTEAEKEDVWEGIVDMARDMSHRDVAELLVDGWHEAEWAEEHARNKIEEGYEG